MSGRSNRVTLEVIQRYTQRIGGNTPEPATTIVEVRQKQLGLIKQGFNTEPSKGLTTTLGLKVDCDRVDKDNFRELLDDCQRKGLPGIQIRLYDNSFANVTLEQLQTIINEIQEHGLALHQRKWQKEMAIEAATKEKDIKKIKWDSAE